jgi:Fe-S oxidoreductase
MWRFVYPVAAAEEPGIEVLHASELLGRLLADGSLPVGQLDVAVTYHDPCDLGRKSGVIDAPRQLLRSIPGVRFVEMPASGQVSDCCGGGGNLESFDPDVASEVSLRRVERACEVLPDAGRCVLVSACQQCERTLTAAARRSAEARRIRMRVRDVSELVWDAVVAAEGA